MAPDPVDRSAVGPGDALLIVDVQIDFLPNGKLPVPDGDSVIPPLDRYLRLFAAYGAPVFATRDWHPPDHCSFKNQGGRWPPHCIAGSPGAAFAAALELPTDVRVIDKATDPLVEALSGFKQTDLEQRLRDEKMSRLFVGGLATEFCVACTVADALARRFEVVLLIDAIAGIDLEAARAAVQDMLARGATARSMD